MFHMKRRSQPLDTCGGKCHGTDNGKNCQQAKRLSQPVWAPKKFARASHFPTHSRIGARETASANAINVKTASHSLAPILNLSFE